MQNLCKNVLNNLDTSTTDIKFNFKYMHIYVLIKQILIMIGWQHNVMERHFSISCYVINAPAFFFYIAIFSLFFLNKIKRSLALLFKTQNHSTSIKEKHTHLAHNKYYTIMQYCIYR